jgi:hypothetical protein
MVIERGGTGSILRHRRPPFDNCCATNGRGIPQRSQREQGFQEYYYALVLEFKMLAKVKICWSMAMC